MTKTKSMGKRQSSGDGSSRSRFTSNKKGVVAPWSDLNHDLLCLVMMKLEVIDFLAFSGVCKSWRSLALPNKGKFMASMPPMAISIFKQGNKREFHAENFEGRMFKMKFPKSDGKTCVGLTCGYLVLCGTKPREFLLMNPATRHALRFPKVPSYFNLDLDDDQERVRAILVFSPVISAWVLAVLCRYTSKIWFSIAGKGAWSYVALKFAIFDLHDFKGKIYAIHNDNDNRLYELGLDPEPKLTLIKTKNNMESEWMLPEFVCTGENLYVMECFSYYEYKLHELDFGEMKWVSPDKKTLEEYAFFASDLKHSAGIKREVWSQSWLQFHKKYADSDSDDEDGLFCNADIWYFPHDCLRVNLKT